ncbi:unnamed protein product [Adineta steineri]|uniref:Uncharacterized protein n=1 Tax=Adineta steineri TaxID=433720 RepID=A0A819QZA0_9BILA|nr:unnamed protein product [Adineta steineri]CAF4039273.1 unnamed protein product [Adineta steineri]
MYHEVCLDKFNLDTLYKWLTPYDYTDNGYIIEEFRQSGLLFKALKSFCELSNKTVYNAIDEFNETQLVTENLLTHDLFTSRIESSLSDFKSMTPMQFFDLLMLIRETTWANQFITIFQTNYQLIVRNDTGHVRVNSMITDKNFHAHNQPCSSFNNRECKTQYLMEDTSSLFCPGPRQTVDGFYASFYPVESLLLSQIQGLYNASFMDMLGRYACGNDKPNHNYSVLSQSTKFSVNSTFDLLVKELFIESWGDTFNYTLYVEQCKPDSCSYTITQKPSPNSIIWTLIGLFGGLSALFRFVTPLIVTFVLSRCQRHERQEEPSEDIQLTGKKSSKNMIAMNQSLC